MLTSTVLVTHATAGSTDDARYRIDWGPAELEELAAIEHEMEKLPADAPPRPTLRTLRPAERPDGRLNLTRPLGLASGDPWHTSSR